MKLKNFVKIALDVLLGLIVAIEILVIGGIIYSRVTGGVPNIFGYNFYVIISDSMEPEIMVDDVIISKVYKGEKLEVGQVITYYGKEGSVANKVVTHKIVSVQDTPNGQNIITQGVKEGATEDPMITQDDVMAVMVSNTKVITFVYGIVSSPIGFLAFIVSPLIAIIVVEIIKMVRTFKQPDDNTDENTDENTKKNTEENIDTKN